MNRRLSVTVALIVLLASVAAAAPPVAINEVAWSGSRSDHTDEWIELVNTTDGPVDLTGWRLTSSDGAPDVQLVGVLPPRSAGDPRAGFYLLERDDDESVPSIAADILYSGALNDAGESLHLYDDDGRLVDSANATPTDEAGSWPAGVAAHGDAVPRSMERVDPLRTDEPRNWETARCEEEEEEPDEDSSGCCGTPGRENTVYNLLPVASIAIEPRVPEPGAEILFDASASADANDIIVSFTWDFGDGVTTHGQTTSHTYTSEGEYIVVLTVEDSKGGRSRSVESVAVRLANPPVADFSLLLPSAAEPRAGDPMVFRSESSRASVDLVSWTWDFGDGSIAEGESVHHTFESAGAYTVQLTVVDGQGGRAERAQTIDVASRIPTAQFVITTEPLHDREAITFDASWSSDPDGEIAEYHWDFDGDDTVDLVSEEPIVEHVYPTGGSYTPWLFVEDVDGDRSIPSFETIEVNTGPTPQFTVSNFEPTEMEEVAFKDHSLDVDGRVVEHFWDFGDGKASIQSSPTHAFASSGVQTVSLTVIDDRGAARTGTATLDVENLPPTAVLAVSPTGPQETGTSIRLDASGSVDPSPAGSIVRYEWDTDGDGIYDRETSASSITRSYSDDGVFEASVRVTDDVGGQSTSEAISITVRNRPPTVSRILWTPDDPSDGAEVVFSAEARDPDGEVVGWSWCFDDEGTASVERPTYVFQADRTYSVSLTVRDDDGARSEAFSVDVLVANALPIASFSISITDSGIVAFDAHASTDPSPNGRIVHVAWDFGDGETCPQGTSSCGGGDRAEPIHEYPGPGTYRVTLVVIDDDGGIARATQTVTIR